MSTYHLGLPWFCNQKCKFCIISAKFSDSKKKLNIRILLKKIFLETEKWDTISVGWWEPTYWSNIKILWLFLFQSNRNIYFITNWSNPECVVELIKIGLTDWVFSFFSFNECIHEKITWSNYFLKLIESLDILKQKKLNININYVISYDNQYCISEDITLLVKKYPVKNISIQLIIPKWRGINIQLPDLIWVSSKINNIIPLLKSKKIGIILSFFPYCLLDYPEYIEKYNISHDKKRKIFIIEKVYSEFDNKCLSCLKYNECWWLPIGYSKTKIYPFI